METKKAVHRKKHFTDINVLDATRARIRYLYSIFDKVSVAFSGGKDSTAVLNVTLEIARELGRLPLKVRFYDEEALPPPTIEYVERVRNNPEIELEWYCLEFMHRNACSNDEPFWFCWDSRKKDLWVRPMPDCAITHHPLFEFEDGYAEMNHKITGSEINSICLTGIRTQESLRRLRSVSKKKNDNYITYMDKGALAHPIYDWSSEDVWRYVKETGCDYNATYDCYEKTYLSGLLLTQRICQPFGEEPLRGIAKYAELWPEMWEKMLHRVKGVATAFRYSNTELYSSTRKPKNMGWKDYAVMVVDSYSDVRYRNMVKKNINKMIAQHFSKTDDDMPETDHHPLTGISWKFIAKLALKGDFKNRQTQQAVMQARVAADKLGITTEEANRIYGKKNR